MGSNHPSDYVNGIKPAKRSNCSARLIANSIHVVFLDCSRRVRFVITYFDGDGNDITLYTSTIPEPTTLLLALAAVPLRVPRG
jgi:hypothetical protein